MFAPVRDAGIETWPILGNHEYRGGGDGVRALFERFPHLEGRRWRSIRTGPVAFVLLDDNLDRLGAAGFAEEMAWYRTELARLDGDSAVRHVVVVTHHPAWTNVWVLPESRVVNEHVVPPFLAAAKTVALFCGHVHAYERFEREGRALIVAGGGGAPRMRLRRGRWRRHPDLCDAGSLRDFHLLRLTPREEKLPVVVESLAPGATEFGVLDRFELPLSARGETRT